MNKIIIYGFDGELFIEFTRMAPIPDKNYVGGRLYTIYGIYKNSLALVRHIAQENIKFDGEIQYEGETYEFTGCRYHAYNPAYPNQIELSIPYLD